MQRVDQADLLVVDHRQLVADGLHARDSVHASVQLQIILVLHHSPADALHLVLADVFIIIHAADLIIQLHQHEWGAGVGGLRVLVQLLLQGLLDVKLLHFFLLVPAVVLRRVFFNLLQALLVALDDGLFVRGEQGTGFYGTYAVVGKGDVLVEVNLKEIW